MEFPAGFDKTSLVWIVILGGAVVFFMLRARRMLRRQQDSYSSAYNSVRGESSKRRSSNPKPREVESWEAELHELSREWAARLDNKLTALQQLIIKADQSTSELRTLLEDLRRLQNGDSSASSGEKPAGSSSPAAGRTSSGAKPSNDSASSRDSVAHAGAPLGRDQGQICDLADAGLNDEQIAGQTGLPIGEVELILRLRGKRE